jgi:hypothetical protein
MLREHRNIALSLGEGQTHRRFWEMTLEYARDILVKVDDAELGRTLDEEEAILAPR